MSFGDIALDLDSMITSEGVWALSPGIRPIHMIKQDISIRISGYFR